MVSLVLIAGFLGGVISAKTFRARSAVADTSSGPSKTVSAEKFKVVDKKGNVRATLDQDSLLLFDKDGAIRLALDMDIYGDAHMSLRDKNGTIRLMLGLDLGGKPYIGLSDEDGEADVKIEVGEQGSFFYLSGKDPDGQGTHLSLSDKDGRSRLWLTVDPDGEPSLNLFDQGGKLRAVLGSAALKDVRSGINEKTATSSVVLFNKSEKVIWSAP
jgi:hypothetical protein